MDNERKDPGKLVDGWLDEILEKHDIHNEIGPDEQAVSSAGLTHPDDMELERIVQESLAENWGDELGQTEEPVQEEDTDVQVYSSTQEDLPEEKEDNKKAPLTFWRKIGNAMWNIPHLLATAVWLILIVAVGVSLGRALWLCAADVLALGKESQEITITVEETDEMSDIADKLQKAGMIRYTGLFEAFANLTGKGENILAGSITFSGETVYDYNALINAMSWRGEAIVTVDVMIPEGYNCAQIFALLEKKGVCSAKDLEEYAANGELNEYWFLDGVERGHKYCLEGFLFPDTYEFYEDDEPREILEKFLDAFDYRFTDRMLDKFAALNQKLGYVHLNFRDLITMASIIEKEKATAPEGYAIASVFYNRLTHASKFPYLNSDATILYATDYYNAGELTTDALINASPYNTYTQPGLPAGPISNPGLASLDAALDPDDSNYYYFIYDEDAGCHRFSKTLEEHNQWADKLGY